MKRLFRTRYRIVKDTFAGFEAQYRCWWGPWVQMEGLYSIHLNTSGVYEVAADLCRKHAGNPLVEIQDATE